MNVTFIALYFHHNTRKSHFGEIERFRQFSNIIAIQTALAFLEKNITLGLVSIVCLDKENLDIQIFKYMKPYRKKYATRFFFRFLIIFFVASIGIWYLYTVMDKKDRQQRFRKQVGTYRLDINKTPLGGYAKDSLLYQKLTLTFKADSTFYMNMAVPFLYDSIGRWITGGGGMDDWNSLYYERNERIPEQFEPCCVADSTFYINSVTPREGAEPVNKIYFKRIQK